MPNYISYGNDWHPGSDDPNKFAAQFLNFKGLKTGFSYTTFKNMLTSEDAECSKYFKDKSFYKFSNQTS